MKHPFFALLVLAGIVLAGCGRSHHSEAKHSRHYKPGDGAIDLRDNEVVIRAGGQAEDAHVGIDGSLSIGTQAVEVSEEGRTALKKYEADAVAIEQHAIAIGVAGAHFGIDTAKEVLKGLFNGKAEEAGKKAEEGGREFEARAYELCDRLNEMYTAQETAAAAIPEFKPYAVISARQVRECREDQDHDDDEADSGNST